MKTEEEREKERRRRKIKMRRAIQLQEGVRVHAWSSRCVFVL